MSRIKEIRCELKDMCNAEAIELWDTGYPERILTKTYKYAFKY